MNQFQHRVNHEFIDNAAAGEFLSSEIRCHEFFLGCISEILNFHSHLSFRLQYLYYSKSFACLLDDHATLHSNVRLVVEVAAQRCGTR